jgi:redox-sensitive bicupin YhaK (pirin superfamily)
MNKPRYQDAKGSGGASVIPVIELGGARVRVITGSHGGETGPIADVAGGATYLDVSLEGGKVFEFPVSPTSTVLLYILDGTALVGTERTPVPSGVMALTNRLEDTTDSIAGVTVTNTTNTIRVEAPTQSTRDGIGTRFLLIAGQPRNEPIAWHGPIVMNTKEELTQAMADLSTGNFIKS